MHLESSITIKGYEGLSFHRLTAVFISDLSWRDQANEGTPIRQGYLVDVGPDNIRASVRVRIEGDKANINIKSATLDMTRSEYEYPIPLQDAEEMLEHLCTRYSMMSQNFH